jgi:hypothetical protein
MAYRLFALVLVLLLSLPALAHHGSNISYQTDKTITLEGVVTEWEYKNPHPQIYFDVKDKDGSVVNWAAELLPTPLMLRNMNVGWSKTTIKPKTALSWSAIHRELLARRRASRGN